MQSASVTVFVGCWNDRAFVFDLDEGRAKQLVEACYRFGDPSEDEYAVGNTWAAGDGDEGWRIVAHQLLIPVVVAYLCGDADMSHLMWQCPCCHKWYGDDWLPGESIPTLFGCGCEPASKYLLCRELRS